MSCPRRFSQDDWPMVIARRLAIASILALRCIVPGSAQAPAAPVASVTPPPALPRVAPESVGLSAAPLAQASDLLRQFVAERKIAGAVAAVARDGKLAYLHAA